MEFNGRLSPSERIERSLSAIGYPLLQGGVSTILCVCSLLLVDTYMSEVFVKTMFLVVTLGLIHGLVIVPAILAIISSIQRYSSSTVTSTTTHTLSISSTSSDQPTPVDDTGGRSASILQTSVVKTLSNSPYLRRLFISNRVQPITSTELNCIDTSITARS
jgi:hypothetical protein